MLPIRFVPLLLLSLMLATPLPAAAADIAALIARGDSADAAMDVRGALRIYREAERLDPRNPELLWRLSKIHTSMAISAGEGKRAMQLVERSIDYARRAVETAPRLAMAHATLAVAYGQKAMFAPNSEKMELSKRLRDSALRALELDPSNTVALLVLGIWHREVASLSWVVRLLLKAVYDDVPDASLEESRRLLARAVQLQPRGIMARLEFAKTLVELDEENEALRQLRTAVALPVSDIHDPSRIAEARGLIKDLS